MPRETVFASLMGVLQLSAKRLSVGLRLGETIMTVRYFQCRMQKPDAAHRTRGITEQVLWIEERGAKVGASVELVGDGVWTVTAVYSHMTGEALREKQKHDRGSLPSIIGN